MDTNPTADPRATLPRTIKASVDQQALTQVSQFFNGTISDMLHELFQNARRAGATMIDVETTPTRMTITDNGHGIANPELLLRFGGSKWNAATRRRETPAGMGVYSLAGTLTRITSRPAGAEPPWTTTLGPDHFRGSTPATVTAATTEASARLEPSGTMMEIDIGSAPNDARGTRQDQYAMQACTEMAGLYLPGIKVTLDGKAVKQLDFLEGAKHITTLKGLRIGVFACAEYDQLLGHPGNTTNEVNVFGQVVKLRLPVIPGLRASYTARIDVIDCPELLLVLPSRKELMANEFTDTLVMECERLILEQMGRQQTTASHQLYNLALKHGVTLTEPEIKLEEWKPPKRDEIDCRFGPTWPDLTMGLPPNDEALIVDDEGMSPPRAHVLRWANTVETDDGSGNKIDKQRALLMTRDDRLKGYPAYDRIPRITRTEVVYADTATGTEKSIENPPAATKSTGKLGEWPAILPRVKNITLVLTTERTVSGEKQTKTLRWPTPIAFAIDHMDYPDQPAASDILLIENADQEIPVEILSDMLTNAFFRPTDGVDESANNYESEMYNVALSVLEPDDARRRRMIIEKSIVGLTSYAPKNHRTIVSFEHRSDPTDTGGYRVNVEFVDVTPVQAESAAG